MIRDCVEIKDREWVKWTVEENYIESYKREEAIITSFHVHGFFE